MPILDFEWRVEMDVDALCGLQDLDDKASSSSLPSVISTGTGLLDFFVKDLGGWVSNVNMLRSSSLLSARSDKTGFETAESKLGSVGTEIGACVAGRLTGIKTAIAVSVAIPKAAFELTGLAIGAGSRLSNGSGEAVAATSASCSLGIILRCCESAISGPGDILILGAKTGEAAA